MFFSRALLCLKSNGARMATKNARTLTVGTAGLDEVGGYEDSNC